MITRASAIKLMVGVVNSHWETDYARKVEEYSLVGISEYWIVEHLLGLVIAMFQNEATIGKNMR